MLLHIIFIAVFIFNLLLFWLTVITKKCEGCRVVGIAAFTVIPFITVFFEQSHFELDYFWWRIAGGAAIVLGVAIAGWARREFKKAEMWPTDLPKTLVISGPYKFVRHPQYLGLIFMWVGWWWVWAAAYSFYFGMIFLALTWIEAYLEEKFILEKRFGDQYRDYRRHAGMFWIK
jgi:protein-S-isoprenylcysteine O-methyltransferase Ste14